MLLLSYDVLLKLLFLCVCVCAPAPMLSVNKVPKQKNKGILIWFDSISKDRRCLDA